MIAKITKPLIIESVDSKAKMIEEYFGRINSQTKEVSNAKMKSPDGWTEPGQTPEFNEYTIVLSVQLSVKTKEKKLRLMLERPAWLLQVNGCNISHPILAALNTYRSVSLRFLLKPSTFMNSDFFEIKMPGV